MLKHNHLPHVNQASVSSQTNKLDLRTMLKPSVTTDVPPQFSQEWLKGALENGVFFNNAIMFPSRPDNVSEEIDDIGEMTVGKVTELINEIKLVSGADQPYLKSIKDKIDPIIESYNVSCN